MAQMTRAELAGLSARTRELAFTDAVEGVQTTLERLLDDVKQLRWRDHYGTDRPAGKRAGQIAHALSWGLANCDVQLLVTLAVEADAALSAARAAEAAEAEAQRVADAGARVKRYPDGRDGCACCVYCGTMGVERRSAEGDWLCNLCAVELAR